MSLSIDNKTVSHHNISYLKPPKWLKYYKSSQTINSCQYHFVSDHNPILHQKTIVKIGPTQRSMTMYYQKQSINEIYGTNNTKDESGLKDFSYLDFVQIQEKQHIFQKDHTGKDSMWALKYQPKAFHQLLTDQTHNRNVLGWLKTWDPIVFNRQAPVQTYAPTIFKNPNASNYRPTIQPSDYNNTRLLLLSGPPGCGKTTLARVVAKHCGYEVAELNASDDRTAKQLITKIQALGKTNSILSGKPTMIIVDQVDGALEHDGNGIKQVLAYISSGGKTVKQKTIMQKKQARPQDTARTQAVHHQKHSLIPRPIIFICNDPFVKGLKELRSKAIVVYFRTLQKERLVKRLKQITEIQKVYIQNDVLGQIARISNYDIRGSLSILEYVCTSKRENKANPKELISKLKVSFTKDSTLSIMEFISNLLNVSRTQSKQQTNLREFQQAIMGMENSQLMIQTFYHNFILYNGFFTRNTNEAIQLYQQLLWVDQLMKQSFKYNRELDHYLMMLFLHYKQTIRNQQIRKTQFPSAFFQKVTRQKQNKTIAHDLISKWQPFTRSTVSIGTAIKQYFYLLYFCVQTSSNKDSEIVACVNKMVTYGIQLSSNRNSYYLFKPQFDSLLTFGGKKLQIFLSNVSRSLICQAYQYANEHRKTFTQQYNMLPSQKQTQELINKMNIKNKRRKRNPGRDDGTKTGIKYKYVEGSGTQITYDLKFKYFFQ